MSQISQLDKTQTLLRLDKNGILYDNYDHKAIFTVEQSKEIDSIIPWTHTKNLFIRDKKQNYYMISLLSTKKLDAKLLKSTTNIKYFSFATADQLYEQIAIYPWSVGIFGLINNPSIKLYIDSQIRDSLSAWRHPNDNTATTVLQHDQLQKYLEVCRISYEVIRL